MKRAEEERLELEGKRADGGASRWRRRMETAATGKKRNCLGLPEPSITNRSAGDGGEREDSPGKRTLKKKRVDHSPPRKEGKRKRGNRKLSSGRRQRADHTCLDLSKSKRLK